MRMYNKSISQIKPYDKNPRRNRDAVGKVANSIKEFGFNQPIVVDNDGVIIVGHTRYQAAQLLGLEKVPVITRSDLTPEQVKAYRIADNKSAEFADWDYDLLINEIDELTLAEFDVELTLFTQDEIDTMSKPPESAPDGDGEPGGEVLKVVCEVTSKADQEAVINLLKDNGYIGKAG